MKRLTKKDERENVIVPYSPVGDIPDIIKALGEFEDFQELLGCPLKVIYKLIKEKHFYAEKPKGYVYYMILPQVSLSACGKKFILNGTTLETVNPQSWDVKLSDYKKTWWLSKTKEE